MYELGGYEFASKSALKRVLKCEGLSMGAQVADPMVLGVLGALYPTLGAQPVYVGSERVFWGVGSTHRGLFYRAPHGVQHQVPGKVSRVVTSPYCPLRVASTVDALGKSAGEVHRERAYTRWLSRARSIVSPQLDAYRSQYHVPKGYDVDHVDPSFQALLDAWLDLVCPSPSYSLAWWTSDRERSWYDYHDAHATLQAIPSSLNRAKGGARRKQRTHQVPLRTPTPQHTSTWW